MADTPNFCSLDDTHDLREELSGIRHHLHRHPELAYQEFKTSDFVAQSLESWGYAVTRGLGGTGMVATLKAGTGSRAVAVRADMDALPINEETGLPYASSEPGRMHACGHDGHTTMVLGAAQHLARTRRFNGTVHLVFQQTPRILREGYSAEKRFRIRDLGCLPKMRGDCFLESGYGYNTFLSAKFLLT